MKKGEIEFKKKAIGFLECVKYSGKFRENEKIRQTLKSLGNIETEGDIKFEVVGNFVGATSQKWFGVLSSDKKQVYYTYLHSNKCLGAFSFIPDADAVATADEVISAEKEMEV
ncbi:hypothetical protein [Dyadobacter sp. 32]|uniref:hypothetical protein n=1 Tax=Dyadobacter sp. 32 TaxID=538966 RepID=UPI0011EF265A